MRWTEFGEPYVTQADAARFLQLSRAYVSELTHRGVFTLMTVRGRKYLTWRSVVACAEQRAMRVQLTLPGTGGDSGLK